MIQKIKEYIDNNEEYKKYKIERILKYDNQFYVFICNLENIVDGKILTQGTPVLVFDENENFIKEMDIIDMEIQDAMSDGEVIFEEEIKIGEDADMKEENIKKLLKRYGAEEKEIENFINDLKEMKDDVEQMDEFEKDEKKGSKEYEDFANENNIDENDEELEEMAEDEEEHQDFLFNAKNIALLKATEEGKDLIMNAPKMAKEELEEAIREYLSKHK